MAFKAGTRLGVYEITGLTGVGGMGEVYKGRDTHRDRVFASKVLPEHIAGDPDLRHRFEREVRDLVVRRDRRLDPNVRTPAYARALRLIAERI